MFVFHYVVFGCLSLFCCCLLNPEHCVTSTLFYVSLCSPVLRQDMLASFFSFVGPIMGKNYTDPELLDSSSLLPMFEFYHNFCNTFQVPAEDIERYIVNPLNSILIWVLYVTQFVWCKLCVWARRRDFVYILQLSRACCALLTYLSFILPIEINPQIPHSN